MMVNEVKNSGSPWQSKVPQEMPWMSTYQPTSPSTMQFGQPSMSGIPVSANILIDNHPMSTNVVIQRPLIATTATTATSPLIPIESKVLFDTQHKRTSTEMEDDEQMGVTCEPPTKQLLSESKLFKKFGSLQIDAGLNNSSGIVNTKSSDSDDSDDEERSQLVNNQEREEFSRYVYLLFKDKNGNSARFVPTNSTLDRLAREERDKLSKAVLLWSPPMHNHNFFTSVEEEEEEDFRYSDHKDFLKERNNEDSITITEVTADDTCKSTSDYMVDEPHSIDLDDVMIE